jgi:2-oxoglutarate/2-oxoacid ferredoxin oxidoreductase subunit beta
MNAKKKDADGNKEPKHPVLKHFREDSPGTPHLWCPGCGVGQVWHYTTRAIEELGLDEDKVLWVGGSGCTGRMCTYWHKDFFHTLHGRALSFATGVKLARPELTVLVHSGDGECVAIGGNHLIHAARRNVDITLIAVNNFNYGMTGGQFSPTTPTSMYTATSPFGNPEEAFNLSGLMREAGATYIARWTTVHARQVINAIKKGIQNKGFSFIEILAQCPTQYGRRNKLGSAVQMMEWLKANSVLREKAERMSPEELKGKFILGELYSATKPEFSQYMRSVAAEASRQGEDG